jgi:hypothetical protein
MQDSETITSGVQHWSDRRAYDYATQMSGDPAQGNFQNGIAPEYMIELCNELRDDLWINIPHMADDTYIRNLAGLVRDHLAPGLRVYVEWSNEVWNGAPGFLPYRYVLQQLAQPQNAGLDFYQVWANDTRHAFDLWSQVFAGQTGRVVRVAAGIEQNPAGTARLLQDLNGTFDAIAPAGYFGPSAAQRATYSASTTADQVMTDTINSIPTALNYLSAHRTLADRYSAVLGRHIQLITYEGGPHLDGQNQPYQAAFLAAGSSPRMYDAYRAYLAGARSIGLDLFMQYEFTGRLVPDPHGVFGTLNYMDQPLALAPKYRALLDAATGALYGP